MAKRLGKFELPKRLVKDEGSATSTYAKYVAEPFERASAVQSAIRFAACC